MWSFHNDGNKFGNGRGRESLEWLRSELWKDLKDHRGAFDWNDLLLAISYWWFSVYFRLRDSQEFPVHSFAVALSTGKQRNCQRTLNFSQDFPATTIYYETFSQVNFTIISSYFTAHPSGKASKFPLRIPFTSDRLSKRKELRRESFSAILQHSTLSIIMIVPSLLWENIKYIAQNYSHKSFSFAEFFYPVCTHEWNSCKFTFINHFFCSLSSERKSTEHFTGS